MKNATFTKRDHTGRTSLLGEAAALRWLAEAEPGGGLRVTHVLASSASELVEERIAETRPTPEAARAAGRALAVTHAAGAPFWGAPPSGWEGAYRIDDSLTPCATRGDDTGSWGAFYARWRIEAYLAQLPRGFFSPRDLTLFDELCARLRAGEFDAPQPALVGEGPARVHGDLWAGNLLWDADPANATRCALIDPMAHGGHAEEDLAMLALFGCPCLDELVAGYQEVSPLAEGWEAREGLMQLAPLLLHCILFGDSYAAGTRLRLRNLSGR